MWATGGLVWSSIGLSLLSPRYPIAARLRQGIGVTMMILIAIMAWQWWSGTFRADIDLAWLVTMAGIFASDLVKRRASRAEERAADEPS